MCRIFNDNINVAFLLNAYAVPGRRYSPVFFPMPGKFKGKQ
ncbi:hypothetical protein GJA_2848 [Janthinobacterium agaricidamnosum NBRC 102515 = DSM 9628]|uniref:Uncharacterized protein n=1 Tax=Janthinobacterium agaricidamnosum NBRC 102515 = DSM 9628 TaxID=1349767 RepID=W0V3T3_9BURK|nr:hypothetical protein GJA_2848 [Janthinobacterium agaricidamnosum NBRC 102515 = DSM 9628]